MDDSVLKHQALGLWMHGQKHHLRGDLERAIALYTDSLGLYPTAEAYTFRGWAYSVQGRVDDAIEECNKAIAVDPTFGNPYNDIGSYLITKGQLDEAIEWLEKAKAAPRYEPRHFPYMNLGRIYALKGWCCGRSRSSRPRSRFTPGSRPVFPRWDSCEER